MEAETQEYISHVDMKVIIHEIRDGYEFVPVGDVGDGDVLTKMRKVKLTANRIEEKLWNAFTAHLSSRGEVFLTNDKRPYYWDKVSHRLYPIERESPMLGKLLAALGLYSDQAHTKFVIRNLIRAAEFQKRRPVYTFTYLGDAGTIYLYQSETTMFRITDSAIEEVPLGTDDVLLLPDGLGDWPSLAELTPHIEELRPKVGNICTKPLPGLPMARLTTRWATKEKLTEDQQWTMLITRFMFLFVASKYPTWSIIHIAGMPGTGKTTAFECYLAARTGFKKDADSLPNEYKDLVTSVVNSHVLIYDNVDGGSLDQKGKAPVIDLMCQVATGAEVPVRQLFTDSKLLKYKVQRHAFLSSCTNPFERDDVLRRVIELKTADPEEGGTIPKNEIIEAVIEDRLPILAEMVIRAQNIARAHKAFNSQKFAYKSKMIEYERYTYVCAMQEGTLTETQEMWATYMQQYRETITESNPMVFAVKLWLGSDLRNAKRVITATQMFGEVQDAFDRTGQMLRFTSPSAFGKNIAKNQGPLSALGFETKRTRSGISYIIDPSPELLQECTDAFNGLQVIAMSRIGRRFKSDQPLMCTNYLEESSIDPQVI